MLTLFVGFKPEHPLQHVLMDPALENPTSSHPEFDRELSEDQCQAFNLNSTFTWTPRKISTFTPSKTELMLRAADPLKNVMPVTEFTQVEKEASSAFLQTIEDSPSSIFTKEDIVTLFEKHFKPILESAGTPRAKKYVALSDVAEACKLTLLSFFQLYRENFGEHPEINFLWEALLQFAIETEQLISPEDLEEEVVSILSRHMPEYVKVEIERDHFTDAIAETFTEYHKARSKSKRQTN